MDFRGDPTQSSLLLEQALQDWLVEMAKIGYGKSRKQLRYAVKKILQKEERKNPFKDNMPGRKWVWI